MRMLLASVTKVHVHYLNILCFILIRLGTSVYYNKTHMTKYVHPMSRPQANVKIKNCFRISFISTITRQADINNNKSIMFEVNVTGQGQVKTCFHTLAKLPSLDFHFTWHNQRMCRIYDSDLFVQGHMQMLYGKTTSLSLGTDVHHAKTLYRVYMIFVGGSISPFCYTIQYFFFFFFFRSVTLCQFNDKYISRSVNTYIFALTFCKTLKTKMENQNIEKVLTKYGASAKEIYRRLVIYSSPKYSTVIKWSVEFKRGWDF